MIYGSRFLTPNADRCLRQARHSLAQAWRELRAAARWQWRGV